MAKKDEGIAFEVLLPEVDVSASIEPYVEKMRRYYYSIPGDVYNRNDALFRQAIRFMQKHRDTKGESHVFNKCVNSAKGQAFREFVLPVLLGTAALPVALEAAPVLMIYTKPTLWIRMGVNWSVQSLCYGVDRVDYVSVAAEGFSPGGSALSALIEYRPFIDEGKGGEKRLKVGFIHKSSEDTAVDMIIQLTGAHFYRGAYGIAMEGLENDIWAKSFMTGFGTGFYFDYQIITRYISEEAKGKIEKYKYDKLGRKE